MTKFDKDFLETFSHKRKIEALLRRLTDSQLDKVIHCATALKSRKAEKRETDQKRATSRQQIASELANGSTSQSVKELFEKLSER